MQSFITAFAISILLCLLSVLSRALYNHLVWYLKKNLLIYLLKSNLQISLGIIYISMTLDSHVKGKECFPTC